MPKKIIHFDKLQPYIVSEDDENKESVFSLNKLLELISQRSMRDTVKEYFGDKIRFHRVQFDAENDIWELQILKLREKLLPGIASVDGDYEMIQLEDGKYVAESTTILYDSHMYDLYVQRNRFSLGPTALAHYLHSLYHEEGSFIILKPYPVVNRINKITDRKLYKKVVITLVKPDNQEDDRKHPRISSILKAFSAYQGDVITIMLGMGKKRNGFMNRDESIALIKEAYHYPDICALNVNTIDIDDTGVEYIDLLDDKTAYKIEMEYSKNDPITHDRLYKACREEYLKSIGR